MKFLKLNGWKSMGIQFESSARSGPTIIAVPAKHSLNLFSVRILNCQVPINGSSKPWIFQAIFV